MTTPALRRNSAVKMAFYAHDLPGHVFAAARFLGIGLFGFDDLQVSLVGLALRLRLFTLLQNTHKKGEGHRDQLS